MDMIRRDHPSIDVERSLSPGARHRFAQGLDMVHQQVRAALPQIDGKESRYGRALDSGGSRAWRDLIGPMRSGTPASGFRPTRGGGSHPGRVGRRALDQGRIVGALRETPGVGGHGAGHGHPPAPVHASPLRPSGSVGPVRGRRRRLGRWRTTPLTAPFFPSGCPGSPGTFAWTP
jgi:hypothetical protein